MNKRFLYLGFVAALATGLLVGCSDNDDNGDNSSRAKSDNKGSSKSKDSKSDEKLTGSEHEVEYAVSGLGTAEYIHFIDEDDTDFSELKMEEENVVLPWVKVFSFNGDSAFLGIDVSMPFTGDDDEEATCTITVDGVEVSTDSGILATCSYTFED